MTVTYDDRVALRIATEAARASMDVHPYGVYLVASDKNIKAHNEIPEGVIDYTYRRGHPERRMFTACAEEIAVLTYLRSGGSRQSEGTLYSTGLPCPFCARIISLARVGRVVYLPSPTSLTRSEQEASLAIMRESGVVLEVAEDVGPQ